jgi:hypothetical protein
MSMILGLGILSDANIDRVLADPPLIWQLIAPDEPSLYHKARAGSTLKPSLFRRIMGREPEPALAPLPLQLGDEEGAAPDLDKAWHGLHYLLTQTAWEGEAPLNFLVSGGREVGQIDVGYGPARVFTASEARTIEFALDSVPDDVLRARFDPSAMQRADIYPQIWDRPADTDDPLGYLMEGLQTLRGVVATAVAADAGLVVYLT